MNVEILLDDPLSARFTRFLKALAETAASRPLMSSKYTGSAEVLVLAGAGTDERQRALTKHRAKGGRVVVWDLGYWDREESLRCALDGLHPTREHLDALQPEATTRHPVQLREDADPHGPVLLIGLGVKTARMLRLKEQELERGYLQSIIKNHPGKTVLWRPKGRIPTPMQGTTLSFGNTIEEALYGCSYVYCRHSNVAVDACIAGVPVVCTAGAAFTLYEDNPFPTRTQRAEFLRKLSWWNWKVNETAQAWRWLTHALKVTSPQRV